MGRRNGRKPRRVGTAYEDHRDTNSKRETTVEKGRGRQREKEEEGKKKKNEDYSTLSHPRIHWLGGDPVREGQVGGWSDSRGPTKSSDSEVPTEMRGKGDFVLSCALP